MKMLRLKQLKQISFVRNIFYKFLNILKKDELVEYVNINFIFFQIKLLQLLFD